MTTHGPFTFPNATTGDVDRFIYDSEVQTAASLPAANDTDQAICWHNANTTSVDVGPDQGQEGVGGGYLYMECSAPTINGDNAYIEFDTVLDAAAEQFQFNFYTIQRGPVIGNNQSLCRVQINENGGGWVNVGPELGGSGNDTTSGTGWVSQSIDLSNGGLNNDSNTLVRIWIQCQGPTNAWHGDYGVDTIEIVGTPAVSREQDSFRFEDDDGSESGSTFLAAQNVDITRGKEDPFRVRVGSQMDGDAPSEAVTVQVKETSDAASEWRDV